jgi:DNA-binding GntR family transcriptional regulator
VSVQPARRPSLVDNAEDALRNWLAPGRHRPGDRLPPEHDLAAMLGVSRGTLRTALQRLEASGEIVRRQGSGTFVGEVSRPRALEEGLERLESYTSLARDRGTQISVARLRIEELPVDGVVAEALGIEEGTPATTISRLLLTDGVPWTQMDDVVHPDIDLPSDLRLRRAMDRGDMVLDVLIERGLRIAYASTRIIPRLVTPRESLGRAFAIKRSTAVLELQETFHVDTGEVVHHARDIFAPGGLDLRVLRWLELDGPGQVTPAGESAGRRSSG